MNLKIISLTVAVLAGLIVTRLTTLAHDQITQPSPSRLQQACASFTVSGDTARNTVYDPLQQSVEVTLNGQYGTKEVTLPVDQAHDFRGCSPAAKKLLQDVIDEYTQEVVGNCKYFREVLSGQRSAALRDGRQGNKDAAKTYVQVYCSAVKS